jgi:hypothetical protein
VLTIPLMALRTSDFDVNLEIVKKWTDIVGRRCYSLGDA